MVKTRLCLTRLAAMFLVLAALGLAFHTLTDAVCAQPENSGGEACTSALKTSAPTSGTPLSCGIIHAGCLFPASGTFVIPLAFIVITVSIVIHLNVLRFSPPAQPPKQLLTQ